MSERPTHFCPLCGTQYFEDVGECDWCPNKQVIHIEYLDADFDESPED